MHPHCLLRSPDELPCGLLAVDEEDRIVAANRTVEALVGAAPLAGRRFYECLSAASRIFCQTHVMPLVRLEGAAEELHLALRRHDGSDVPVLANAVHRGAGTPPHTLFALLPAVRRRRFEQELVEARRAAEEALRSNAALTAARDRLEAHATELDRNLARLAQRNQELATITRMLFHDLGEQIRKIGSFAELARTDGDAAPAVARIGAGAARAQALIDTLRRYATFADEHEPVTLVCLDELVADAREAATQRRGAFALEAGALPAVQGRRSQLALLFEQLLDNAAKYRDPAQPLVVRLDAATVGGNAFRMMVDRYRRGDFVRITMTDNGLGFERAARPAFELLARKPGESTIAHVGLAMCKRVVDNHGGSIAIDSAPGAGTTVTLMLPLQPESGDGRLAEGSATR